ncbi:MAG: xanthine dehydrogenase family protein molybdopterin-binding subunit [Candidatus Dormibacteria bacterium]
MTGAWVGRPLARREDRKLVQGAGTYLDDVRPPDCAHLVFARCPVPHARLLGIDTGAARALAGVLEVLTAQDLPQSAQPLPLRTLPLPPTVEVLGAPMPLLAGDRARFAGEAVAAVVAESRALAEDGADLVQLDLASLPAVSDLEEALRGGVVVHESAPGNVVLRWTQSGGEVEAAFDGRHRVVRGHFRIPRLQAAPIEPRGCVASYSQEEGRLTLWCSSQDPHRPLRGLSEVLGLEPERIRVIVPDVGGAFGSKGGLAAEHAVAAILAMRLQRPVKWVETRSENFLAAYQGRGMEASAELAVDAQGRFQGIRVRLLSDAGAYLLGHTAVVGVNAVGLFTGAYTIPAAQVELLGVATNKVPTGPYRGAGRPEAAFVVERMVDIAARELGIDPVELRRRNLVPRDGFPHRTPLGAQYDSGDFPALLDRALELVGYEERRRQPQPQDGRRRGVGVAVVVEPSGNGLWEAASARLLDDGGVLLLPGSSDHGQGHQTTFAQIAADALGIDADRVEVREGDSAEVPAGVGTFASRSVSVGGSAVLLALEDLRHNCQEWASHLLDVPPEELHWEGDTVRSSGGQQSLTLAEIAKAVRDRPRSGLPALRGDGRYSLQGLVYGSSACAAAVEVDTETGSLRIERLAMVDDAGTVVNPLLAEGQVIGSAIQGVAAALFEEVAHDPQAQPLTESFLSYTIPTAPDVDFDLVTEFRSTPSPLTPLGTKGVAESGCIGVPPALANAVVDALAGLGVVHADPPYSPERIWRLVSEA